MPKNLNKKFNSWLASLAINAIILIIVLLLTNIMYETNDDFGIAYKLSQGYPYIGFVNYFLCKVLIVIQGMFTKVNVFILAQLMLSFVAFTVALRTILERSNKIIVELVAVGIILMFSVDHYAAVQFTKTASLLMATGLLLLVDNYLHEKKIGYYVLAYAFFYIGVAFRADAMIPAIGFVGAFMLLWFLLNGIPSIREHGLNKKDVAKVLLIIVIALVPYGIDMLSDRMNASTPELAYAREYQAERTKVTDYPLTKYYEKNAEAFNEIGLDENDIKLVSKWMLDYDGAASLENLKKINKITAPSIAADKSIVKAVKRFLRNTFKDVTGFTFKGMHIIVLAFLSLMLLMMTKRRNWWYIIFMGGMMILTYVAIIYLQRENYRAFYIGDISACFWLLYVLAIEGNEAKPINAWISGLLCLVIAVTSFAVATTSLNRQYVGQKNKIESDTAVQFYEDNSDKFYVCATLSKKRHPSYLTPLKIPVVERNATGLGGWGTLAPFELDQLAEFGMNNLVGDLINHDNRYFLGTSNRKAIEKYYNKWYADENSRIKFVNVGNIEGTIIAKVVKESK